MAPGGPPIFCILGTKLPLILVPNLLGRRPNRWWLEVFAGKLPGGAAGARFEYGPLRKGFLRPELEFADSRACATRASISLT